MAELVAIGTLTGGGSGGGPISAGDISDSTPIGRAGLRAATQQAGREAIGAMPATYRPDVDDITDSGAVGRAVLAAESQSTARNAMGAAAASDIPTDKVSGDGVSMLEKITRTEYDALIAAGTTVPTTLYVITGA